MNDPAALADQFIHDALRSSSAGVDLDLADVAIQEALKALKKQAEALAEAEYSTHEVQAACLSCKRKTTHTIYAPAPDMVARAASHTAKVVDGIVRMAQFAKGQPDSRPDMGGDWLRALSDEQLRTVQNWVSAAKAKD